jgi:hypothetical protein
MRLRMTAVYGGTYEVETHSFRRQSFCLAIYDLLSQRCMYSEASLTMVVHQGQQERVFL